MAETHLSYLKLHVLALHPGAAYCQESVGGLNALEAVPLQGSVHGLMIHVAVKLLAALKKVRILRVLLGADGYVKQLHRLIRERHTEAGTVPDCFGLLNGQDSGLNIHICHLKLHNLGRSQEKVQGKLAETS